MQIKHFLNNVVKALRSNSPEILTALGVSGVVTTSYLVGKASFKASKFVDLDEDGVSSANLKENVRVVWKLYIPAGISGVLTVGCIIGASKANGARTTAAVTAYSISERAFGEYREKVVEQIGKGKEQKIRDEIVQERISKNPSNQEIVIVGGGHVLCCELFTHRYFRSDMERLKKAQNDINAKIINERYVTLDELYDLIGLPDTSNSNNLGWDSDKLMALNFSTVISEDGEPCLAFDYNYTKPIK